LVDDDPNDDNDYCVPNMSDPKFYEFRIHQAQKASGEMKEESLEDPGVEDGE
jgi:hypothetical protein